VIHHKLFPTNVFLYDNLVSEDYLYKIKNSILEDNSKSDTSSNWQSSYELHTTVEFRAFANLVLSKNERILKSLGYHFDRLQITDMWANVLKPGQMHEVHNHSNNFYSGVFYVSAEKTSGINFMDPRPQATVFLPKKDNNLDNTNIISYESQSNRMLLFPSWLSHWVPINKSEHDRISISWNIMIRGELGEHEDFQSTTF